MNYRSNCLNGFDKYYFLFNTLPWKTAIAKPELHGNTFDTYSEEELVLSHVSPPPWPSCPLSLELGKNILPCCQWEDLRIGEFESSTDCKERFHPKAISLLTVAGSYKEKMNKQTNKQTKTNKQNQTNRQTNKHTYIHTYRQTDRQTNKQTNKHTDRQTNKPFIPHSTPTKKKFLIKSKSPKKRSIKEIWVRRTPTSGVG